MKDYVVLNCFCLSCHWTWEVLSTEAEREQECLECKSYNVKTFLKTL